MNILNSKEWENANKKITGCICEEAAEGAQMGKISKFNF
jgi:hypothetical protein